MGRRGLGKNCPTEAAQQDSAYFLRTKQSTELALGGERGSDPVPGPEMGTGEGASLALAPWCLFPNLASPYRARVGRGHSSLQGRSHQSTGRSANQKQSAPLLADTGPQAGRRQGAELGHSLDPPSTTARSQEDMTEAPQGETRLVPAAALRVDAYRLRTGGEGIRSQGPSLGEGRDALSSLTTHTHVWLAELGAQKKRGGKGWKVT